MNKRFLKEQKKKLKKEEKSLEIELKSFAKKDPDIKGNWKSKLPFFGSRTADPSEETDQVEEYGTILPIEHALEIKLQKIKNALGKIKGGTYGVCRVCKKEIGKERLSVCPEADLCIKCAKEVQTTNPTAS